MDLFQFILFPFLFPLVCSEEYLDYADIRITFSVRKKKLTKIKTKNASKMFSCKTSFKNINILIFNLNHTTAVLDIS